MRISVIGCGYLGAVHAAGLASLGHDVVGIDTDQDQVRRLAVGSAPFHEPGLPELLRAGVRSGALRFSSDLADAAGCEVHFVCVGTPQVSAEDGAAYVGHVDAAVAGLLPHLTPGDLVVGKSTVPVGTASRLAELVRGTAVGTELVWNPEFLREGRAVQDTLHPDRVVLGVPEADCARAHCLAVLTRLYEPLLTADTPLLVVDYPTAELVKVAANAFLATKISFINSLSEVCDAAGADVRQLADAIGHDARIGRQFLDAGLGFGGGCLPKDIRAFSARAGELGVRSTVSLLREVDAINMRQRSRTVDLALELCGGSIVGRRIAVLGAAFKPGSDDVRDSPALHVADLLATYGADVVVTDPEALANARRLLPDLTYAESVEAATVDADVVLLLTEWPEYVALDPHVVGRSVLARNVVDGRGVLDPDAWTGAGWSYRGLGRKPVNNTDQIGANTSNILA